VRELREADLAAHYNQTPPRNRRPNRNCDRIPAAFLVPQDDPPTQGSNSEPHLYRVKTRRRTAQCLFYFDGRSGGHFPGCEANRRTESAGAPVRTICNPRDREPARALLEVRQEGRGGSRGGEAQAARGAEESALI